MSKRTPDRDWLARQARQFIVIYGAVVLFFIVLGIGAAFIMSNNLETDFWTWSVALGAAALLALAGAIGGMRE